MKKILLLLIILITSMYCFAQPSKNKGVTDCNELTFWIKEIQSEFKSIQLTSIDGDLTSKRMFKGFDTTEFKIFDDEKSYHVKGIAWRFKSTEATRNMFKKLVALVKSCNLKVEQSPEGYWDNETNGFVYFKQLLPQGKLISIEISWKVFNEENPTEAYQNLFFTIHYGK